MSNTFSSFSINDGDWVRVRQFIQHVSTIELQGGGSLVPYTGAISNVNLGSHTFTTTGTAATGDLTVSSTLVLASGSITDSSGGISFNNENLSTAGSISCIRGASNTNQAFGLTAMTAAVTGTGNTAVGNLALEDVTSGSNNTCVGYGAGKNITTRSYNVCIGKDAGSTITTGYWNVAIGRCLYTNTVTGYSNVAIGHGAMAYLNSGSSNFALGFTSLENLTSGSGNIGVGVSSLQLLTTNNNNIGIGTQALYNCLGTANTAIGGGGAGYTLGNVNYNTVVGFKALFAANTSNNVAIGTNAGRAAIGAANIFIGYGAGYNEAGSNKLYIANSDTITPLILGDFNTPTLTIHGRLVVNESGLDYDTRIEGLSDENLLFIDASTDRVGVGIAVPLYKLHVNGTSASDTHTITAPTTTDYLFTTRSTKDTLAIQSQTTGTKCTIELFTKDGDGSDEVTFRLFAQGTPENITNLEDLDVRYDPSGPYYVIRSFAAGSGTLHPIWLGCGAYTDQLVLNSDGNVGVNTATPDSQFEVKGESRFGNSATAYAQFSSVGLLTLVGNARVINHLRFGAASLKPGAASPTAGLTGVFPHLAFSHTVNQDVNYSEAVPNRWDNTTEVEVCIDWVYTGIQDNGTVKWDFEYRSVETGELVDDTTTTITQTSPGTHTTGQLVRTCFSTMIPSAALTYEDDLGFRLGRDQANDTLGTSAKLISIHFHFVSNKLGEQYAPE